MVKVIILKAICGDIQPFNKGCSNIFSRLIDKKNFEVSVVFVVKFLITCFVSKLLKTLSIPPSLGLITVFVSFIQSTRLTSVVLKIGLNIIQDADG